ILSYYTMWQRMQAARRHIGVRMTPHRKRYFGRSYPARLLWAFLFAAVALTSNLLIPSATAQADRPIKIIVPSTPGGGADVVARLLATEISRAQKVTVVVENRSGGGNVVGIEAAARAEPDGNTILLSTPEFVINPHLQQVNYDPLNGFESVCYLARS